MSRVLQTSDLIFPSQETTISQTLSSLKRSALSISNRLRSIVEDSEFVRSVAEAYHLPLIANERCGSWYIRPLEKVSSAYFKSTDGHTGQWSFSLRRLNVQVLDIVGKYDGCIIVDSTRRGKSMPDALSKTVPIWCAVFNALLFPHDVESHRLHVPPQCVSSSEHAQIKALLGHFQQQLIELKLDIAGLRAKLSKPLRPIWTTRDHSLPEEVPSFPGFHPVVLCISSKRVVGAEISEGGYIQGAGDDSEGWSCGLNPSVFWKYQQELLRTPEGDLSDLISSFLEKEKHAYETSFTLIKPTNWIFIGSLASLSPNALEHLDLLVDCSETPDRAVEEKLRLKYAHLKCRLKKLGSRDLRGSLPKLIPFLNVIQSPEKIYICCPDGEDLSIGTALAILCLNSNESGTFISNQSHGQITKSFIRQRLSWIITSLPSASPSRSTLQSINDFLLTSKPVYDPLAPFSSSSSSNTVSLAIPTKQPQQANSHPLIAVAIFSSLTGTWSFHRTLTNSATAATATATTTPVGTVSGTATFSSHLSSNPCVQSLLQVESGMMRLPSSSDRELSVSRRWIWQLGDSADDGDGSGGGSGAVSQDVVSVHLVKPDGVTPEKLYNTLRFDGDVDLEQGRMRGGGRQSGDGGDGGGAVVVAAARDVHPCGQDIYESKYCFYLGDGERGSDGLGVVDRFEIRHDVRGPAKDYVSMTRYSRS